MCLRRKSEKGRKLQGKFFIFNLIWRRPFQPSGRYDFSFHFLHHSFTIFSYYIYSKEKIHRQWPGKTLLANQWKFQTLEIWRNRGEGARKQHFLCGQRMTTSCHRNHFYREKFSFFKVTNSPYACMCVCECIYACECRRVFAHMHVVCDRMHMRVCMCVHVGQCMCACILIRNSRICC